jgi:hypothetical protein
MSKKHKQVETQVESNVPNKDEQAFEPIYLRDTLIEMQHFLDFGFDKYMLRALLPDECYTFRQADEIVKAYCNKK